MNFWTSAIRTQGLHQFRPEPETAAFAYGGYRIPPDAGPGLKPCYEGSIQLADGNINNIPARASGRHKLKGTRGNVDAQNFNAG